MCYITCDLVSGGLVDRHKNQIRVFSLRQYWAIFTNSNCTSRFLSDEEPTIIFSNGVLYIDNIKPSHDGKEFPVINLDSNNIIKNSRLFLQKNDSARIGLVDVNGSLQNCGHVDISYSVAFNDGYNQFTGFTPTKVNISFDWNAPSSLLTIFDVNVNFQTSYGSYRLDANGYGDFRNIVRRLSGSVTKY